MKTLKYTALSLTVAILGCSTIYNSEAQSFKGEIVQQSLQCKSPQQGPWGKWIHTPEQLLEAEKNANYTQFNYQPNLSVDFSQFEIVVAGMGVKPSLGFSMQLLEPVKRLSTDTLQLTIHFDSPGQDRMVGQAVSSPCILIKLPKTDAKEIEVVDQLGVQLYTLSR